MRQPHYLKRNKGVEIPTRCVFLDTETTASSISEIAEKHTLWFGKALYKRRHRTDSWSPGEWLDFTESGQLWDWIEDKAVPGSKLYLYAHNLVYDLTITQGINTLTSRGWRVTKAIVDDPPTVIQFRRDKSSIMMIDSFNYFRSSLAAIGESIGIPKLTMPLRRAESKIWSEYCQRDVTVLAEAMINYFTFIASNGFGNYQVTLASQAFTAFRHKFMTEPIYIDGNEKALSLAREAYHGGRTEALYIGSEHGQYYTLDVNSMYPAVMAMEYFPSKLWTVISRITLEELAEYIKQFCIVARVKLDTDEPVYPLVMDNRLIFPVGQFEAVLTTPALEYAIAKGHLRGVSRASLYARNKIFAAYVMRLFDLRREYQTANNLTFAWLCKIMLNSLYGKFGQLGRVYDEIGEVDPGEVKVWREWDVETKSMHTLRSFGGVVQELTPQGESYNSHPAIAAHVTELARIQLWRLISQAGIENVYYMDTDSLTVNQAGLDNMPDGWIGEDLGQLKIEASFQDLTIHGAKDYIFGDKKRIKGIRAKAKEIQPGVFTQDRFSKFKTLLRAGDLDSMIVYQQTKHLSRIYHKGVVLDTGRVRPFVMPDEDLYHQWLNKRYEVKIKWGSAPDNEIDPRDAWRVIQDDLDARRLGNMIYQRHH